jgi:hypothetical protein
LEAKCLFETDAFAKSEAAAREALKIRQDLSPNHWRFFDAVSQLGECLLGQDRFAEAEQSLLDGYRGLKQQEQSIPMVHKYKLLNEASQRLVRLYETQGRTQEANQWRIISEELAEYRNVSP